MIVAKNALRHVLRSPEDDTSSGLNIEADPDAVNNGGASDDLDRPDADEDRGDVVVLEDEPTIDALRAIAGEPAPAAATPAVAPPAADDAHPTGQAVPYGRFSEVNRQRKEAEAEAERLRQEVEQLRARTTSAPTAPAPAGAPAAPAQAPAAPAAPAFDVRAANRHYAELLADGEFDQATELKEQIDTHNIGLAEQRAIDRIERQQAEATQRAEEGKAAEVAERVVAQYAFLDTPEGAPAMQAILTERNRLVAEGQPLAQALQSAVNKFGPVFAPMFGQAAPATPPGKGLPSSSTGVDTRTQAAIARAAQVSNQQPAPLTGGMGNGSTAATLDPMDMSEAQFEALTPEQKRQLRGD